MLGRSVKEVMTILVGKPTSIKVSGTKYDRIDGFEIRAIYSKVSYFFLEIQSIFSVQFSKEIGTINVLKHNMQ